MASRYGTDYLDPYENILEGSRVAAAAQSERDRINSINARVNPLIAGPDAGLAQVATGTVVAPVSTAPNPLTRAAILQPPVPLSTMPVEQQINWRTLQDKQRADQLAAEASMLKTEVDRRTSELKEETIAQGRAMINELPSLQEKLKPGTKIEDYEAARADLLSKYPAAGASDEIAKALAQFDSIHGRRLAAEEQRTTAELNRKGVAQENRLKEGLKEAGEYGATARREYERLAQTDPDKAADYLAQAQRDYLKANLRDAGLSEQQIEQKYGTEEKFNVRAAEQFTKTRGSLSQERARARTEVLALEKERTESGFDPVGSAKRNKDPYEATGGRWTPTKAAMHEDALAYWQSLLPKVPGVDGMPQTVTPQTTPQTAQPKVAAPPPPQLPPAVVTKPPEAVGADGRRYVKIGGGWYPKKRTNEP